MDCRGTQSPQNSPLRQIRLLLRITIYPYGCQSTFPPTGKIGKRLISWLGRDAKSARPKTRLRQPQPEEDSARSHGNRAGVNLCCVNFDCARVRSLHSSEILRQHRTIWQEHSAKDFASYESYKRAGILYVFPPFITARMGQKIGRRPQTQLCGDALIHHITKAAKFQRFSFPRRCDIMAGELTP